MHVAILADLESDHGELAYPTKGSRPLFVLQFASHPKVADLGERAVFVEEDCFRWVTVSKESLSKQVSQQVSGLLLSGFRSRWMMMRRSAVESGLVSG